MLSDRFSDIQVPAGLQGIAHDVRFAARLLRKDRGFTFAATMTLTLGIGAAGTIFTIFDGMFLKGLPVDAGAIAILSDEIIYSREHQGCFGGSSCGTCINTLTIPRADVEARVLQALQEKLMRRDFF